MNAWTSSPSPSLNVNTPSSSSSAFWVGWHVASTLPRRLWDAYVAYLWSYQPHSWVGRLASTFRILAVLLVLPVVLLTLLVRPSPPLFRNGMHLDKYLFLGVTPWISFPFFFFYTFFKHFYFIFPRTKKVYPFLLRRARPSQMAWFCRLTCLSPHGLCHRFSPPPPLPPLTDATVFSVSLHAHHTNVTQQNNNNNNNKKTHRT